MDGTIRLRLFKGSATVVGRGAPTPLYRRDLVTYSEGSTFDQGSATGFIDLFGLPGRIWATAHGL